MGTLDCPKPEQRGRDIDAAISGVGAAGFVGRHLRQQPGKQRENDKPRQQPQRRAVEPPPRPKGKATGDLAESGERINEIGAHSSDSLSASAERKSAVWGKSVSVRVDLGGHSIMKKKTTKTKQN